MEIALFEDAVDKHFDQWIRLGSFENFVHIDDCSQQFQFEVSVILVLWCRYTDVGNASCNDCMSVEGQISGSCPLRVVGEGYRKVDKF